MSKVYSLLPKLTVNERFINAGTAKIHVISRDKQNRPSSAYYSIPSKMPFNLTLCDCVRLWLL
jgi:hypothetical protein